MAKDKKPVKKVKTVEGGIRSADVYYRSPQTSALHPSFQGTRPSPAPGPKSTDRIMSADEAYYRERSATPAVSVKSKGPAAELTIRDEREAKSKLGQAIKLIQQGKSVSIRAPREGHGLIREMLAGLAKEAGVKKKFAVQLLPLVEEESVLITDSEDIQDSQRRLPARDLQAPVLPVEPMLPQLPDMSEGALAVTSQDESIGPQAIANFKSASAPLASNEPEPTFAATPDTVAITDTPVQPLSDADAAASMPPIPPGGGKKGKKRRFSTDETDG